jgi:hypothetical protein
MHDHPVVPPVPPGSTPLREFACAIAQTLTLPKPATVRDEVTYLRISRDRARLVLAAARRVLRDREIEDDPHDLMIVVASLRDQTAQLPDDSYDHSPDPVMKGILEAAELASDRQDQP